MRLPGVRRLDLPSGPLGIGRHLAYRQAGGQIVAAREGGAAKRVSGGRLSVWQESYLDAGLRGLGPVLGLVMDS